MPRHSNLLVPKWGSMETKGRKGLEKQTQEDFSHSLFQGGKQGEKAEIVFLGEERWFISCALSLKEQCREERRGVKSCLRPI